MKEYWEQSEVFKSEWISNDNKKPFWCEKILPSTSIQEIGDDIESADFVRRSLEDKDRFIPM